MARFANSVLFNPSAGGTADFVVSSAVQGYMTPALAGAPNGVYKYRAESADLSQWEIGEGTLTGTTLARTTVLYNSSGTGTASGQSGAGTKINFSTTPQVGIVLAADDVIGIDQANAFSGAQRLQARNNISAVLAGHLFGLNLSTSAASATFGVTAGECADSTALDIIKILSSYSKTTSAWAVGSGNGALDTSTIANNTWYHVFAIKRPDTGVTDILISTSATAPTLPSNYTLFRRIGSLKTDGSAQWTQMTQNGDEFLWSTPPQDSTGALTTTATLITLSVPPGVKVLAKIGGLFVNAAGGVFGHITSPDQADVAASLTLFNLIVAGGSVNGDYNMIVRTNTSAQIRGRASAASSTFWVNTYGWIDDRGRQL